MKAEDLPATLIDIIVSYVPWLGLSDPFCFSVLNLPNPSSTLDDCEPGEVFYNLQFSNFVDSEEFLGMALFCELEAPVYERALWEALEGIRGSVYLATNPVSEVYWRLEASTRCLIVVGCCADLHPHIVASCTYVFLFQCCPDFLEWLRGESGSCASRSYGEQRPELLAALTEADVDNLRDTLTRLVYY